MSNPASKRLKQDYIRLKKDPVPYVVAEPLPCNMLEWHYVVFGPKSTPYDGGMYHGKLLFPKEFPFKPPSIYMITPNGRFKTNTRLCLSISDYHPDTWNPSWSVSTILTGLLSFMVETSPTVGSIDTTEDEKRELAYRSINFNLGDKIFCEQFPALLPDIENELERRRSLETEARERQLAENNGRDKKTLNQSDNSPISSLLSNCFVLASLFVFVMAVKYIVGKTPME